MKNLADYLKTITSTAVYEKQELFGKIGSLLSSNAALITGWSLINKCPRPKIIAYSAATLTPRAYNGMVALVEDAIRHNSPIQQSIHRDVYIAEKGDVDWLMIIQEGEGEAAKYFVFY